MHFFQNTQELIKDKMWTLEKIMVFEEIITSFKNINNIFVGNDMQLLNIQKLKQNLKILFTKFKILTKLSEEEIKTPQYKNFFADLKKNYNILCYRIKNTPNLLINLEIQEEKQFIKNIQNSIISNSIVCEPEIINFSEFYDDELYQNLCYNYSKRGEIIPQLPIWSKNIMTLPIV
ncbi:hypothetical protein SMM_0475 [Spiroplasma mirum ATCC 29335]|nr:hypothetical protein SMM_0475 [Spiroplasma mirum ATCC 29335]